MYSPLNTDLMFQEMRDRAERIMAARGSDDRFRRDRRWWHREARAER